MPFTMQATQNKLRPFDRALYLCNIGVIHSLRGAFPVCSGASGPCGSDACWAASCMLLPGACEKKCC